MSAGTEPSTWTAVDEPSVVEQATSGGVPSLWDWDDPNDTAKPVETGAQATDAAPVAEAEIDDLGAGGQVTARNRVYTPAEQKERAAGLKSMIGPDARDALRRAVEANGETYDPEHWSFEPTTILGMVAERKNPAGQGRDWLAISDDCRTQWVGTLDEVETVHGDLVRAGGQWRSSIEWTLSDASFWASQWTKWYFLPVSDLGWLCSRRSRWGVRRVYYAVARNRNTAKVSQAAAQDMEAVTEVLRGLCGDETREPVSA